jgi:hypothetical protein
MAAMHHGQHLFDAVSMEAGLFKEMQFFMFAVFKDKPKTLKVKLLVSNYETTCTELYHVKQLRPNRRTWRSCVEAYLDFLFSACSTINSHYDPANSMYIVKRISMTTISMMHRIVMFSYVDTDVLDLLPHVTDEKPHGNLATRYHK